MSKKEETAKESPKKRLRAMLTAKNILVGGFLLLFFVQYFQIQGLVGTFSFLEGRDSSLVTEIGQIKEAYLQFGTDMNEMREYLRLPTKNYFGFDEVQNDAGADADQNVDQLQLAMFKYVSFLSDKEKLQKNVTLYTSFLNDLSASESFVSFLTSNGLSVSSVTENGESISLAIEDMEIGELLFFYISKEDGTLLLKTPKLKENLNVKTYEDFEKSIKDLISKEKDDLLKYAKVVKQKTAEITDAINSESVQAAIAQLSITIPTSSVGEDSSIVYSVYNYSNEVIGKIAFDPVTNEISLIDSQNEDVTVKATDIKTALLPFLEKLDTRTFLQKKADEAHTKLEATLNDAGFKLLLSEAGLSLSEKPREDEDRIYYDIFDEGGTHISSLVVEKMTGVINVVNPDGTNSENLLFFDPELKKKTLKLPDQIPNYGDSATHADGTFNILIAGKHGSLVDTMIFTHIDEVTKEIRMISIPRDLFYNGRKINALPYFYGMPELKKVLSDITGYELDKYILIDMYAFIDVIDLIGGIDVHLDSAVIDPTYRTVDNGVEGTLHYEPGDYHLGGVEALRLARSRHTSSDFARAERQQMILEALQTKARNFGFGDADTIYEIAKSVLAQTETDITLDEAIAYYFRYQNYDIISNNVMSSGNVLYVPPYITSEDCDAMVAAAQANGSPMPGCQNENHAYTLLPMNDNWNIVKWFFKENFEVSEAGSN